MPNKKSNKNSQPVMVEAYTKESKKKFREWKNKSPEKLKLAFEGKTEDERMDGFKALMARKLAKIKFPKRPKKEEIYTPEELEEKKKAYKKKEKLKKIKAKKAGEKYKIGLGETTAKGDRGSSKNFSPSKSKWARK